MDTLIEAFSRIKNAVLLIAGDGTERAKLEQMIKEFGLVGRVHLLGNRTDIPNLLKSADCFVFLSRYEGFGIVIVEAMAAGLPIIISNHDSAKEIIKDGTDGVVVDSGNIGEIVCAMEEMMVDRDRRLSLASKAIESAKRFSIPHHVDSILKLI